MNKRKCRLTAAIFIIIQIKNSIYGYFSIYFIALISIYITRWVAKDQGMEKLSFVWYGIARGLIKEPAYGIFSEEDHSQCSANQVLATKQGVFAVLREQNISCRLSHKAFTERLHILLSLTARLTSGARFQKATYVCASRALPGLHGCRSQAAAMLVNFD